MRPLNIDPDLLAILPPVLIQVVRALGIVRAREFLLEFGGQNITLAKHHSRKLKVSDAELGRLRECLAGHMDHAGRVYMTKADKLINHFRDEQIRREVGHKSISQQVIEYKLCVRQIVNIRAGERDEVSTGSKSRKSLNLSEAEITVLTRLAQTHLDNNQGSTILQRILNKLDRARLTNKTTGVTKTQFDLF